MNSSPVLSSQRDWNFQKTFTGRAGALWKPTQQLSAELAFLYSDVRGNGGPESNPTFAGGPYPLDPRLTLPAGGPYDEFATEEQPFTRTTKLLSLDLSYDVGFATVSSTTSYFTTAGSTINDDTYSFASEPFIAYYGGSPVSPRYLDVEDFTDRAHTLTEEVRLVSTAGGEKPVDYTVGVFYESQERDGTWNVTDPGVL